MKEELTKILALQELTERVEQVRRDKEMLRVDVGNSQRALQERKRRVEQVVAQRKDAAIRSDAAQLKIEEAEAEIKRLTQQLNITKHQKEYDVLRKAIAGHQADIQRLEDEELAALETVDKLAVEIQKAEGQVAAAEQELGRVEANVARLATEYDERILQMEQQAREARQNIKPGVLAAYQRLAGAKMRTPLATVRRRVCQGCHTQITPQTLVRLRSDVELVNCPSCGRILILDD
ncbi:MAG: zinc ribbon domain-containing protein [Alphaproteobacteria bacterium]